MEMSSLKRDNLLSEFARLREQYQPDSLDFQHCLGYVDQATRNGLYAVVEDDTSVVYTSRRPDTLHPFVIVASAGRDRNSLIAKTAHQLARFSGRDVIVKNVDLDSRLKEVGFEDYREDETWDQYSRYDDNTFPQQVIVVSDCLGLEGSKNSRLREEVSRFHRESPVDVVEGYSPEHFDMMLSQWVNQMSKRNGLDVRELTRSHEMFREPNYPSLKYRAVNAIGRVVGLLTLSPTSRICLGHNGLLNDFSVRGSCRALQYEAVKIASAHGYSYLNIQGSEEENQHRSKRRFKAAIEIPKKHMVLRT